MPRLEIIIASTRPGRVGRTVGDWFAEAAREHGGFDVHVTDLAELDLPFHDEPHHPAQHNYVHDHTKRWSEIITAADAVVFVMPEYNFSFSGVLKNAVDFLYREWAYKPVGFVSYGGASGGMRAVHAFRPVMSTLRAYPLAASVAIPFVRNHLDENGVFSATSEVEGAAKTMLDELAKLAPVMAQLHSPAQ